MAIRITQTGVQGLVRTTSNTRVTQSCVQALTNTPGSARVTQSCVQALTNTPGSARVTQGYVQALVLKDSIVASVRVTQDQLLALCKVQPTLGIPNLLRYRRGHLPGGAELLRYRRGHL